MAMVMTAKCAEDHKWDFVVANYWFLPTCPTCGGSVTTMKWLRIEALFDPDGNLKYPVELEREAK